MVTKSLPSRKICPECGAPKDRHSALCRNCYDLRRDKSIEMICTNCGKAFKRQRYQHEKAMALNCVDAYCSQACSAAHHAVKHAKACKMCGKAMPGKPRNKYCSLECRALARPKRDKRICPQCQKEFVWRSSRHQYCSRDCANAAHSNRMIGDGNSHYRNGSSYADWFRHMRPLILERDQHQCVVCGTGYHPQAIVWKGKTVQRTNLIVHHINENPQDNTAANLITLCKTCHAIHHKSAQTPWEWFAEYAEKRNQSMTCKWQDATISLQTKYSFTTA